MINVIASIKIHAGRQQEFLEIFRALKPTVAAEDGCHTYFPAVDIDCGLPVQTLDPTVVTVIERWESLAALQAHLKAAHMTAFREKTAALVAEVSLRVLQDA
jgi:quinol monooxygenase YgiN